MRLGRSLRGILTVAAFLSLQGCFLEAVFRPLGAVFGEAAPAETGEAVGGDHRAPRRPVIVGTVRFTQKDFVLIHAPAHKTLAPGTRLSTLDKSGQPQSVVLQVSEERKGTFLTADVLQGKPQSGHLVVTFGPRKDDRSQKLE